MGPSMGSRSAGPPSKDKTAKSSTRGRTTAPAPRKQPPWGSMVGVAAPAGATAAIGLAHPWLGISILLVELSAGLAIIGTALLGSRELSERAFRLLRCIGNRPEPPSPASRARRPR